jgi:hypothetical protein
MSVDVKNSGTGAGGSTNGAGAGTGAADGGKSGGSAGAGAASVPQEKFDEVLSESIKRKEENKALQDRIAAMEADKLKATGDWKGIAEAKEKEANDARAEATKIRTAFVDEKKFSAIREKCAALGIRPEAISDLEGLDLSRVQIETTSTGKINVLGAGDFAERLKANKPHWFTDKSGPNVNTNGTRVLDTNGAEVTVQSLLEAEREGKKTGDMTKYHQLHRQFQQQRAGSARR